MSVIDISIKLETTKVEQSAVISRSVSQYSINLKRIVINVSGKSSANLDTQYPVVSEVAEDLDWKIQTKADSGDWDVFWTDSAILPEILFRMHFFQKINHYPGIHIIARKNLLGLSLMGMR